MSCLMKVPDLPQTVRQTGWLHSPKLETWRRWAKDKRWGGVFRRVRRMKIRRRRRRRAEWIGIAAAIKIGGPINRFCVCVCVCDDSVRCLQQRCLHVAKRMNDTRGSC